MAEVILGALVGLASLQTGAPTDPPLLPPPPLEFPLFPEFPLFCAGLAGSEGSGESSGLVIGSSTLVIGPVTNESSADWE